MPGRDSIALPALAVDIERSCCRSETGGGTLSYIPLTREGTVQPHSSLPPPPPTPSCRTVEPSGERPPARRQRAKLSKHNTQATSHRIVPRYFGPKRIFRWPMSGRIRRRIQDSGPDRVFQGYATPAATGLSRAEQGRAGLSRTARFPPSNYVDFAYDGTRDGLARWQ